MTYVTVCVTIHIDESNDNVKSNCNILAAFCTFYTRATALRFEFYTGYKQIFAMTK